MEKSLACCYFPTTLVFVDDNLRYLKGLKLNLIKRNLLHKTYNEPLEALTFLNQQPAITLPFIHQSISTLADVVLEDSNDITKHAVDIDLAKFHHLLYQSQRFQEVGVVIVDYAMPMMDGLTFCRQLKNPYLKKIMLTSEADHMLAVKAFNDGIIDRFVRKDEPLETLITAVTEMQYAYFQQISEPIIQHLKSDKQPNCFNDPDFVDFFSTFCEERQAVEFYLLDIGGSYLFLDKQANPSWLIVKNEREMHHYAEIAKGSFSPGAVITYLQKREKIPFLYTETQQKVPWPRDEKDPTLEQWLPLLHPAQKLTPEKKYYYAVVENPSVYPLKHEQLLSYQAYWDKQNLT